MTRKRPVPHSQTARSTTRRGVGLADPDRAYRRFLPYEFMNLLGKASISDIRLGDNVEKNITILFADIRDFTSLSEPMTPRENFRFINSYLRAVEPALFQSHGFIDKYIGDAIMAVFPTNADDAVQGALGMLNRLRGLNAARRRGGAAAIRVGIGLNTGLAMVGAVGGPHRIEATVISDAVNLASRLETLTKTYGVELLISEHVLYSMETPAAHDIRFIDRVRVKGKEQPQSVYEVFDADPPGLRSAKRRTKRMFEEALAHYHFRDIAKARTLLRRCLAICPEDKAARFYADRSARFAKTGIHQGTGEIGMPIVWGEQYRINIPVIDEQHRALFAQVNKFMRDMHKITANSQVEPISRFLRHYVFEHFESEERIMREAKYPQLQLQQQQHERFRRDVFILDAELRKKFSTQRTFMLFKIQLLVVDWIAHHTMILDRHFGRYMARASRDRIRSTAPASPRARARRRARRRGRAPRG